METLSNLHKQPGNELISRTYNQLQDMLPPTYSRNSYGRFQVIVVETYKRNKEGKLVQNTAFGSFKTPIVLFNKKGENKIYLKTNNEEIYIKTEEEPFKRTKGNIELLVNENTEIIEMKEKNKDLSEGESKIKIYMGNIAFAYLRNLLAEKKSGEKAKRS